MSVNNKEEKKKSTIKSRKNKGDLSEKNISSCKSEKTLKSIVKLNKTNVKINPITKLENNFASASKTSDIISQPKFNKKNSSGNRFIHK